MSANATNENLPARIGRYDVVFPLAARVASSLVVGRLNEPGASPVTILQIDPELTADRDVESFLFSVREALVLRHPNIAAIRELRNDDGVIYLVMEHLEGESGAALIHRLEVDGRALDFELAAHVVAEATRAIHAGHQLGLLHEHLTPHDIFVGYDGTVKVLDIGIARPLDELLGAKTIGERDLPYASPERCKGDTLDRRSDVYSLGAVLWELMTGSSPYERKTQAETLRAILTDQPKVPSSKVLRRLPSELSGVVLRALARDPAERYESAEAFGDALRAFVRSVPMGGAEPSTVLATLMQSQFAKRIKNNTRMLRRFDAGTRAIAPGEEAPISSRPDVNQLERPTFDAFKPQPLPVPVIPAPEAVPEVAPETPRMAAVTAPPPPLEPTPAAPPAASVEPDPPPDEDLLVEDDSPDEEEVEAPAPAPEAEVVEPAAEPPLPVPLSKSEAESEREIEVSASFPEPPPAAAKRNNVGIAIGLVVLLGLGAILYLSQSSPSEAPPTARPVPTTTTTTTTTTTATTTATASAPAAPSSSAVPERTATIHIETTPPKATVVVGNKTMGVTPIDLELPQGKQPVTVEVRATGYQSAQESIVPDADQRLKISLAVLLPTPSATPPGTTTASPPASAPAPAPASASASAAPYYRFE